MSDVHLITAMFASVDRLTNILQVRNISFTCADGLEQENIPSFKCNTLIISDAYMNTHSKRNEAAFVAVNCAAIPENMLEALLFGHEKGSFTGASTTNKGIFRAADGGTLLLDEISEMPLSLQAKLLRALQEKAVTPIGSQASIPVDIRVIATTNRNMVEEIRNGNFREDLYYRLNVFPLSTLSLAERPSDIVAISTVLISRHCPEKQAIPFLAPSARNLLINYKWPGNVRELENVIQRALVLSDGKTICAEDIIIDNALHEGGGQAHIQYYNNG